MVVKNTNRAADEVIWAVTAGDIIVDSVIQLLEDRIARASSSVINRLGPTRIIIPRHGADKDKLTAILPRKWTSYDIANKPTTEFTVLSDRHQKAVKGAARCPVHYKLHSA